MLWIGVTMFGAVIGSFFNVILIRKNTGESIVVGASHCLSCGVSLRWWHIIPVISFLLQRGRCRHCGSSIPVQYLLVEALTAGLAAAIFWKTRDPVRSLFYFGAFSALLLLSFYDIRQKIVDTHILVVFLGFAVVEAIRRWWGGIEVLPDDLVSAFFIALFFYLMWLLSSGRWMGRGDADIAFSVSLFLGFPRSLGMLLGAFWIGGAVGIILLLARRHRFTLKSEVPFGPFFGIATFLLWYFGGYFDAVYALYFF